MISQIFNLLTSRNARCETTGQLRNGQTYEIRRLNLSHLDAICDFHQKIHDALKVEERTFISRKSREDFHDYLQGKGAILGVICNGQLIAMGNLLLPTAQTSDTGTADMVLPCSPRDFAVLQSDSVLPAFRGQGLHDKLIAARVALASDQGRKIGLALADTKNAATIKNFRQAGFEIKGNGIDPDDQGNIFHLQKKLNPPCKILGIRFGRRLLPP